MKYKHLFIFISLITIYFNSLVYSQDITRNNATNMASVNTESFSFFYAGHAYGTYNDDVYWDVYDVEYPATSLLSNVSVLKEFDFAIFGGDLVQRCLPSVIEALEVSLLNRLDMPIFNSAGSNDICLADRYNFEENSVIQHGSTLFLVLSSEVDDLELKQVNWLTSKLKDALTSDTTENIFLFTNHPIFLNYIPESKLTEKLLTKDLLQQEEEIRSELFDVFDSYSQSSKQVYWLAGDTGDMGRDFPVLFHQHNQNVQFIVSAIYDDEYDHVLDVRVFPDEDLGKSIVEMNIVGLSDYEFDSIETYSYHEAYNLSPTNQPTLGSLEHLQAINSNIVGKVVTVENPSDVENLTYDWQGHIDFVDYNSETSVLLLRGWTPVDERESKRRTFTYTSDYFVLKPVGFKTFDRPDVVKIFGDSQLSSGFELSFEIADFPDDLTKHSMCFFVKPSEDQQSSLIVINSEQTTINCELFSKN